jgi:penicillin-binding protein-related factor A (putative recombinase)
MNVRVKYDVRVMNVRVKRVNDVRVNDAFFRSKSGYSNLVDY